MVWGAISGYQKGPLFQWKKEEWGNITARGYTDHILPVLYGFWSKCTTDREEYALRAEDLWPGALNPLIVMQDNAPVHTARISLQALEETRMIMMEWPPSSPGLNPIENIWAILKARIFQRRERPTTVAAMRKAVEEEWEKLSHKEIWAVIKTMPARVQAVLEANGGATRW